MPPAVSLSWPTKMMPGVWASREAPCTRRLKCGGWFRSEIPPLFLRFTNGSGGSTGACKSTRQSANEYIALRPLYLAGRPESFCDSHRLRRFRRREVFQMVWLPSPAVRRGEWIVMRVVGGDLGGGRHGG